MESYNISPTVPGSFDLASCFQDSSMQSMSQNCIPCRGRIIFYCMYLPHCVYPLTYWWTFELLLPLAVVRNTAMPVGTQRPVPAINFFGPVIRSGMAWFYGDLMFNFLRNWHTLFHSSCTVLHFVKQCTGFQFLRNLTNPSYSLFFCFLFFW